MSDKRANSDIEDVLSSVLRLVSEDMRVPGHTDAGTAGAADTAAPSKLVLTPAQRVAPPVPQNAPLAAEHLSADAPQVGAPLALPPTLADEAALRDTIRDILRDELQGPLGERITRSVRKLVLAEVQRAMATRDLD